VNRGSQRVPRAVVNWFATVNSGVAESDVVRDADGRLPEGVGAAVVKVVKRVCWEVYGGRSLTICVEAQLRSRCGGCRSEWWGSQGFVGASVT
jgi:hypothetical protein